MLYVKYHLTQDAINRSFVETGITPPKEQHVEVDPSTFTAADRQVIVDLEWAKFLDDTRPGRAFQLFPKLSHFEIASGLRDPYIKTAVAEFDHYVYPDEAMGVIRQMAADKKMCEAELPARMAVYLADRAKLDAQRKAETEARRAEQERQVLERAAKQQAERQAAMLIPWKENNKAICNLYDAIKAAADVEMDTRFSGNWIKEIAAIEWKSDNGFTFDGKWVERGTVEIERGTKHVYLVAGTSGSRKYQTTIYRIVILTDEGIVEPTAIMTDNDTPGWALRIRDQVASLL